MSPPRLPRSPAPSYAPRGEEGAGPETRGGAARGDPSLARRRGTGPGPVSSSATEAPAAPPTPPLTLLAPRSFLEEAELETQNLRVGEGSTRGTGSRTGLLNPTLAQSEDDGIWDPRLLSQDPAGLRFRGSGPGSPLPGPRD